MKDKILDIVAEHCVGWKNCEALTEKLFDLYDVSQQRELLKAFREWWNKDNDGLCTTITHKDIERYLESL